MKNQLSVSVLVPVFNEEKTIADILEKLISLEYVNEIVVINDCSTDSTEQTIQRFNSSKLVYFKLPFNQGKTAAIKKAKELATKDVLVIQDADLEYDPEELFDVLNPIFLNQADVVYGSRFLVKKTSRVLYFYHYLANKTLTFISNFLTNINFTDIETCYKAFRQEIFKPMPLTSKGFGMEVEITAMISKLPIRIFEVPISYYGRTYEEGKKIGATDGFMALYYILYFNIVAPFLDPHMSYIKKIRKSKIHHHHVL